MTTYIADPSNSLIDDLVLEIIDPLAADLSHLADSRDAFTSETSWQMAYHYISATQQILAVQPNLKSTQISKMVRTRPGYTGWGADPLNHAIRIEQVWPGLIEKSGVNPGFCVAYDDVRRIAVCSLSKAQKDALLAWIQTEKVTQLELRARIAQEQADQIGTIRPDFELQLSNHWRFNQETRNNGFDGGISPQLVANLLYYLTDAGDVVIDPMAGGDTTYQVVKHYRFFSEDYAGDFGGPRTVLRCDLEPRHAGIQQADVTDALPWPAESADFCLFDPPYYGIANGKYPDFGRNIEEWEANLERALTNVRSVLKLGGYVAVIIDDYLRADEFQPAGALVFRLLRELDLRARATIYNSYPNYLMTMNAIGMWRAKRARLMVNGMKIIHVFEKVSE
jgi:hypothetical protein